MRSIKRIDNLDPADLVIKWRMTEMCNINCSYCIRSSRGDKTINQDKLKEQENRLCEVAKALSNLIDKNDRKNVKLDLIGGEVTILNLQKILSNISTTKITKIQITTNLMRDADYYINLINLLHQKGIRLSMTASCHYEFQNLDKYFEKAEILKDKADIFTAEIVSNDNSQELCKEFKKRCEELNLYYMIEADLRMQSFASRQNGLMVGGRKPNGIPRYKVTFTDGSEEIYQTRNSFLYDKTVEENVMQKMIHTEDMYCTNSWNFFYVDFDMVGGRTENNDSCTNRMKIEDFKLISPKKCIHTNCTLCGHMSLWRD